MADLVTGASDAAGRIPPPCGRVLELVLGLLYLWSRRTAADRRRAYAAHRRHRGRSQPMKGFLITALPLASLLLGMNSRAAPPADIRSEIDAAYPQSETLYLDLHR